MANSIDTMNMSEMLNNLTEFITNAENVLVVIGGLVVSKVAFDISWKCLRSFWTYVVPRYLYYFKRSLSLSLSCLFMFLLKFVIKHLFMRLF